MEATVKTYLVLAALLLSLPAATDALVTYQFRHQGISPQEVSKPIRILNN